MNLSGLLPDESPSSVRGIERIGGGGEKKKKKKQDRRTETERERWMPLINSPRITEQALFIARAIRRTIFRARDRRHALSSGFRVTNSTGSSCSCKVPPVYVYVYVYIYVCMYIYIYIYNAAGHICRKRDSASLHVNLLDNSKTKFRRIALMQSASWKQ